MKLLTNKATPFGRKVAVAALERGLFERIEVTDETLSPVAPGAAVAAANPLGKIPCLLLDDGTALYDSRVICEYLDHLAEGPGLFPQEPELRWRVLTLQALGDGILDAAVGTRYETTLRPEPLRWSAWSDGQKLKTTRGLDRLEADAARLTMLADIGAISVACALGYLDFRYAHEPWRPTRRHLAAWFDEVAARPSMERTAPG